MQRLILVCALALLAVGPLGWLPSLASGPFDQTYTVNVGYDAVDTALGDGLCHDTLGKCPLRAAIMEANSQSNIHAGSSYTILIATNFVTQPLQLSLDGANEDQSASGDLDVSARLKIMPSAGVAEIAAQPNFHDRIFQVQPTGMLTLVDLSVRNGRANNTGGGISAGGPLTLIGSSVQQNTLTGTTSADGGGIFASGPLTLSNSTVQGNRVVGVVLQGGGVFAVGPLVVERSVISANLILADGNSPFAQGGGLMALGRTLISDTIVANNAVTVTSEGGGGSAAGGGLVFTNRYTVTNSTVRANRLSRSNNVSGRGAGILSSLSAGLYLSDTIVANSGSDYGGGLDAEASDIEVRHSTFSDNATLKGGGGGVYVVTGTLNLSDSTLARNQAATGGGITVAANATLGVARSVFYLNTSAYGGGIENHGLLTLTNSTLFLNEVGSDGAGLYNFGSATLNSDTFSANIVQYPSATFPGDGGGIWNGGGGAVYMRNSVLDNIDIGGEAPDCFGNINVLNYNLIHSTAHCTLLGNVGQHNLTGIASGLQFLDDNGGSTLTSAPAANSPLIEAGNPGGCWTSTRCRCAPTSAATRAPPTATTTASLVATLAPIRQLMLYLPLTQR